MGGIRAKVLINTGAAATLISKELWEQTGCAHLEDAGGRRLVGVQGTPLVLNGVAKVPIQLQDETFTARMLLADQLARGIDVILGRDFLKSHDCVIEMGKTRDVLHLQRQGISIVLDDEAKPQVAKVRARIRESLQIPPASEIEVMASIPSSATARTWMVEGLELERNAVMVARAIVSPDGTSIPLRFLNWRNEITKGTAIADMELIEEDDVENDISSEMAAAARAGSTEISPKHRQRVWEMVNREGNQLDQTEKEHLYALFLEYEDLFAKGSDDFGRTGNIKYTIDTGDSHPICQQARRIPPFRKEEVSQLLSDMLNKEVIQHSKSLWASPVVLVKKKRWVY